MNAVFNASRQLDLEFPETITGREVDIMLREKMARWSKESDDAIRQAELEKQAAISRAEKAEKKAAKQKQQIIEALRQAGIDPNTILPNDD